MLTLSLMQDQALVLFDWLSREDSKQSLPTEHEAEQKVLWLLEGMLERALVAPLQPGYPAAVSAARERVLARESDGGG